MSDLTPREKVFCAADSGVDYEIGNALDNYRSNLIQAVTDSLSGDLDKAKLVSKLRDLDSEVTKTCYEGNAEVPWYYFRNSIEDVLEVPRGTLDTGDYEEHE